MNKISGLKINEAEYDLPTGEKGKMAIFFYSGPADPQKMLDYAIREYVGNNGYHELIDANLDNPWMRVIVSDINSLDQKDFDPITDKLKPKKTN